MPAVRSALWVLLLAIHAASCGSAPRVEPRDLRLFGEYVVPNDLVVDGTPVGGLSAIDLGPSGELLLLSDDRSRLAPARFYRARLEMTAAGISGLSITGVTKLLRPDGAPYPAAGPGARDVPDPEALRFDRRLAILLWTSEGDRSLGLNPAIRAMTLEGEFLHELPLHPMFSVEDSTSGPRNNGVFEAMALSSDGAQIIVALEQPLLQDGPATGPRTRGPVRISYLDATTGALLRQVAYQPEFAPMPRPDTTDSDNGVVELLPLDGDRLLILERAWARGVGNAVRLFIADCSDATDVSEVPALAGASYAPARKQLLADLASLGLTQLDNFEGMCWGPPLSDGRSTLLLISDNNFNPDQKTILVALAVDVRWPWRR